MMARDILFLLKENFEDGSGSPYFCPDCAYVSGVLSYFPKLRHSLDIQYVDFDRPRKKIVELIGEKHQGCPVLVLAIPPAMDALGLVSGQINDRYFVSGPKAISLYWAHIEGISRPH